MLQSISNAYIAMVLGGILPGHTALIGQSADLTHFFYTQPSNRVDAANPVLYSQRQHGPM
jgi:hypothetical protein